MAISDKLNYLIETKSQLKETINYAGAGLTDETFRQYPEKLYDKYLDILKDNGEELFNGLPKDLGSGTSISMNNTANTRMKMSLAPSELEQATTTGKNLFDYVNYTYDKTIMSTYRFIEIKNLKANTTYTIYNYNVDLTNPNISYIYLSKNSTYASLETAGRIRSGNTVYTSKTYSTDENGKMFLAVYATSSGTGWSETLWNTVMSWFENAMFVEGESTTAPYEPYTGGIASPNPDYPQDIHTISGDNEIKVENKNLFDKNNQQQIVINPITGIKRYGVRIKAPNKKVSISASSWSGALAYKLISGDVWGDYVQFARNIIVDVISEIIIYIGDADKLLDTYTPNLQIEINDNPTDYQPHQEQTLPLTLGTLEYCKIDNYEDEFYMPSGNNIIKGLISGSRAWGDGVIGDNEYYSRTDYIEVKPSTAYYIQHGISSGKGYTIWCYDSNKTTIGSVNLSGSSFDASGTITTLANTKYIIANFYNETINTNPPMINEGSTALPYEPYNNGKWYLKKNIGKVVLNGSETWSGTTSYYTGVFISTIDTNTIGERVVGYSDYFTVNGYNYSVPNNLYFHPNKNCHISNQNNVYYASLDAWKTWLSNHHTTVYYRLATPEYTLLNDTLQQELNNIKKALSYNTQTNISQENDDLPFVISASAIKEYELNEAE